MSSPSSITGAKPTSAGTSTGSSTPVPLASGSETKPLSAPTASPAPTGTAEEEDDDGDEERLDLSIIRGFASKIQRMPDAAGNPPTSRGKIVIPKRGEKDFEPLQETVNLQEMMLQNSREALFDALVGVRGGSSKSMSHALITPSCPFPRLLVSRGHILDHIGISMRLPPPPGSFAKPKTYTQLLPEEALYLLERGALQIWIGEEPKTAEETEAGIGQWSDEEWGVKGAVEMSVMEGFAIFMGKEGLTWERYQVRTSHAISDRRCGLDERQAYAYLKRLGYTIARTRRFLPEYFTANEVNIPTHGQEVTLPPFRTWWASIPRWVANVFRFIGHTLRYTGRSLQKVGLGIDLGRIWSRNPFRGTLLSAWRGSTYRKSQTFLTQPRKLTPDSPADSLFSHLRIVPAGHDLPLVSTAPVLPSISIYGPLVENPYLPFFNVWKPATPWSKTRWDKGSDEGLIRQKPDYIAAIVEARNTPMPSLRQLAEVFDQLPDEPKGPVKRLGPQYDRKPRPSKPAPPPGPSPRILSLAWFSQYLPYRYTPMAKPNGNAGNPMGALRNGDRALIVAVNDSGNTGWVRFGRTGFSEYAVI
ncbi:tRNA-splicing endonuclease subunit Sen54, partial [Tremellales sp. Uapishka_1]